MKKAHWKIAFVTVLAFLCIAASIDIKNSGILVTNGFVVAPVSIPDGTAAAPSIRPTSDPNTGLYSAGPDQLGFTANGVQVCSMSDTAVGFTHPVTVNQPALAATTTAGLTLANTTAAVVAPGATVQVSPSAIWQGSAWETTGGSSDTWKAGAHLVPATGAPSSAKLSFGFQKNAGAMTEKAYVDSEGAASIADGAVGTPGLRFMSSSAAGTGLYLPDANTLAVAAAGSNVVWYRAGYIDHYVDLYTRGPTHHQYNASFGGGNDWEVKTKLTSDATAFNVWAAAALAAESCVNIDVSCSAVDKADTAGHASWRYENICCNKAGTTTCDAATAVRAVAAGTIAAATVTIVPCDVVAGACLVADAPAVQIVGIAATNVNWKCSVFSYVLTNG